MRGASLLGLAHAARSALPGVNGSPPGKLGSALVGMICHLRGDQRWPADHAGPDAQFGSFFYHSQYPDRAGQIMLEGQNAMVL